MRSGQWAMTPTAATCFPAKAIPAGILTLRGVRVMSDIEREEFEQAEAVQASRRAISSCSEKPNSSEAVAWSWENHGRQVTVDKAFADELISDGEIVRPLIFGDTHPASAAPDEEYLRALQDAFDIIQADANTEENYGSLCRIGSVLGKLKDTPTNADVWIKCSDRLPTEDAGTDLDMSVTIGTFQR
jgi:hypothetical protein